MQNVFSKIKVYDSARNPNKGDLANQIARNNVRERGLQSNEKEICDREKRNRKRNKLDDQASI